MSKYKFGEINYVKVDNLHELQDMSDYTLDREWDGFFSICVNRYPLYAQVTQDKVVWRNTPMVDKGHFISVTEYLSEDLRNRVYVKPNHYIITFGDTTVEVTGEVTISGEEGTWTFGKK